MACNCSLQKKKNRQATEKWAGPLICVGVDDLNRPDKVDKMENADARKDQIMHEMCAYRCGDTRTSGGGPNMGQSVSESEQTFASDHQVSGGGLLGLDVKDSTEGTSGDCTESESTTSVKVKVGAKEIVITNVAAFPRYITTNFGCCQVCSNCTDLSPTFDNTIG